MIINSSITLEVIFRQCYDLKHLHPAENLKGCLECFQGIYMGQQYQPAIGELSEVILKTWHLDREGMKRALSNFRKPDDTPAFTAAEINQEISRHFNLRTTISYPPLITSNTPKQWDSFKVGEVGLDGQLTRLVASTDHSDQKWGGTWGSEWRITILRGNEVVIAFGFPSNNPRHEDQQLRNLERTDGLPVKVMATDAVHLGAFRWYPGHITNIRNTVIDLYIDVI